LTLNSTTACRITDRNIAVLRRDDVLNIPLGEISESGLEMVGVALKSEKNTRVGR